MVVTHHNTHYLHNNYQFNQHNQSVPLNFLTPLDICLLPNNLRLSGSELEHAFFTLIFPPLCFIGIVGNCLNLIVLLNGEARHSSSHRSNRLLVALAFCDILFLLAIIPHSLANYDFFGLDNTFRVIYFSLKMHFIGLANFFSGITIWLVIAVSAERLLGIRSLLRVNSHWSKCTTVHIIGIIVLISALLNFYNNVSHHCILKHLCNNTQVISKCFNIQDERLLHNQSSPAILAYVRWSIFLNILFIVFIPIVAILFLNVALLMVVRRQSFLMYNRLIIENNSIYHKNDSRREKNVELADQVFRRSIDQTSQFNAERRVTVLVVAVVTCFVVTQGPSAIVLLVDFLYGHNSKHPDAIAWYNISILSGFLVMFGKALNFILFCLSSGAFRRRLVRILSRRNSFNTATSAHIQESIRKFSTPHDVRFSVPPHDF